MSVLDFTAPLAEQPMPQGWRDVDGLMLLAMSERLGSSLTAVLLAATRAPLSSAQEQKCGWYPGSAAALELAGRTMALEGWFSYWAEVLEGGGRALELEASAAAAAQAIAADAALSRVYLRTIALGELPSDEAPTFSSIVTELRPDFRVLTGRDARVGSPAMRESSSIPWVLGALGAWYVLGKRL